MEKHFQYNVSCTSVYTINLIFCRDAAIQTARSPLKYSRTIQLCTSSGRNSIIISFVRAAARCAIKLTNCSLSITSDRNARHTGHMASRYEQTTVRLTVSRRRPVKVTTHHPVDRTRHLSKIEWIVITSTFELHVLVYRSSCISTGTYLSSLKNRCEEKSAM